MTTLPRIVLPGTALLLLFACGPNEPAGTQGALKEGGFVYCDGNERSCDGSATVPDHLAVGSTFTIQFSTGGISSSGPFFVLSGSDTARLEEIASNDDGSVGFRALSSGSAQVEARATAKGELVDFVRLDLGDIETLALRVCPRAFNSVASPAAFFDASHCGGESLGNPSVEISQGSSLAPTVCAVPLNGASEDLSGHLTFDWSIADGASAKLEMFVSEDARCATIGGLTQGSASITVVTGVTSSVLDVSVSP